MMNRFVRFLFESRGQSLRTTGKIVCNRFVYALNLAIGRHAPSGRLQANWHWFRHPFSLRGEVLWSPVLGAWFCPEDESAIECMLHMQNYEPIDWVAPKSGDVFLDVGGYVGWYSIQAARAVGDSGRVLVLEPDSANRKQLERNLALNNTTNAQILSMAAWSRSGTVNWRQGEEPVWHRVSQAEGGETCEAISIDDLIDNLNLSRLDWIKLDIEGGEVEAIAGAARTLTQLRPRLFIEVHETRAIVEALLRSLGYRIERERYDLPPNRHGWILAAIP